MTKFQKLKNKMVSTLCSLWSANEDRNQRKMLANHMEIERLNADSMHLVINGAKVGSVDIIMPEDVHTNAVCSVQIDVTDYMAVKTWSREKREQLEILYYNLRVGFLSMTVGFGFATLITMWGEFVRYQYPEHMLMLGIAMFLISLFFHGQQITVKSKLPMSKGRYFQGTFKQPTTKSMVVLDGIYLEVTRNQHLSRRQEKAIITSAVDDICDNLQ